MEAIKDKLARFAKPQQTKHEFEFQEICEELEPHFGKLVWTLPHKPGVTEFKLRNASKIARKRGNLTIPYLMSIIKKLP